MEKNKVCIMLVKPYLIQMTVLLSSLPTGSHSQNLLKWQKLMAALELEPNSGNTLQVAAAVYAQCSNFDKAISAANSSLEITPNDTNWMITGQLASYYFQIDEIELLTELIGENINAKDMDGRVLAYFALIENRKGNKDLATKYLSNAIDNGLTKGRLETNLVDQKLRETTIKELLTIGDLK